MPREWRVHIRHLPPANYRRRNLRQLSTIHGPLSTNQRMIHLVKREFLPSFSLCNLDKTCANQLLVGS